MTPTRMKTAALLLSIATLHGAALATLPLDGARAFAQDAGAASITITFQGVTREGGQIRGVLVDEAAWNGQGKAAAAFALPVEGDSVSTTVTGLAPGRYAVRAFHDLDGDGKMGANPFGIPTEPFAFSNGAKAAFGPPAWGDAAFDAAAGDSVQTIVID
jgi:uncharacterized protein (DUF2141 family)